MTNKLEALDAMATYEKLAYFNNMFQSRDKYNSEQMEQIFYELMIAYGHALGMLDAMEWEMENFMEEEDA